jgi:two-component system, chemotaxis family, chemotaxis protein CheY
MARVLIVDDNLLIRSLLNEILIDGGHDVAGQARDGLEAPGCVRDLRPDLVTLDLVMPGRSGLPTLRHLMMIDHSLPVVVCSAFLNENHVLAALRLGAKGFIVKPFDRDSVLAAVGGALPTAKDLRPAIVPEVPVFGDPLPDFAESIGVAPAKSAKREFVRVSSSVRVAVKPVGALDAVHTLVVNLSGSGMLLSSGSFALGELVEFRLRLHPRKAPIDGTATVVRLDEHGRPAIAFQHMSFADHERLIDYIRDQELRLMRVTAAAR